MRSAVVAQPPVARASAEPPARLRARRTNDPFAGLSKNTAAGRRVADLLRGFLKAIGNPTDALLQANALAAAELLTAAEAARRRLLMGNGDAVGCVRLEGAARRAICALGIKPAEREQAPDLAQYLASRYGGSDAEGDDEEQTEPSPNGDEVEGEHYGEAVSERDRAGETASAFDDAAAIRAPDETNNAPAATPTPLTDTSSEEAAS